MSGRGLALIVFAAAPCAAASRIITADEAKGLVLIALAPHSDGVSLVLYKVAPLSVASSDAFYGFQALRQNAPAGASANVGFFAVDRRTGDVWNAVICEEHRSPELRRQQQAVRKRIGLSDAQYKKLRSPGPMCESIPK